MSNYPLVRISTTGTPTRQRTPNAWRGALEAYNDPTLGSLHSDTFTQARVQTVGTHLEGWWLAEDDVAGATGEAFNTAVVPAARAGDGLATLAGTTGTDDQAVKIQAAAGATTLPEVIRLPSDIVDPRGDVIFEAHVYLNTAEADQFFIGLAVNAAAVLAAGLIEGAQSVLGFLRTDAGDLKFVSRNDNAGGTAVAYSANIVAAADIPEDEWVKLCFRHNKDNTVEVYVDEVRIIKDTDGVELLVPVTALPEVIVVRTVSLGRGATGDNATVALPIDVIECWQGQ